MRQDRSLAIFATIGCAVSATVGMCVASAGAIIVFSQSSAAGPAAVWEGPTEPPTGAPDEPAVILVDHLTIAATVNSFSGPTNVTAGSSCNFNVEHRIFSNNTEQCHVDVVCGDNVHLYGSPSTGYFVCQFSRSPARVVGQDLDTTASDTDGAFVIDTDRRVLEVRDDAQGMIGLFDLRATITSAL